MRDFWTQSAYCETVALQVRVEGSTRQALMPVNSKTTEQVPTARGKSMTRLLITRADVAVVLSNLHVVGERIRAINDPEGSGL